MNEVFFYKDMIDRGFVREEMTDSVWFDDKGYNWFTVTKKLSRDFYLDWDCETKKVSLIRWNKKNGDILGRIAVLSIAQLDVFIEFFEKKK